MTEVLLSKIFVDKANKNVHTDNEIKVLAGNIEKYGLINPIHISPNNGDYRIITGEGRYRAFLYLFKNKKKNVYSKIPVMVDATTKGVDRVGKQLAENKLRTFSLRAECLTIKDMWEHGKPIKEIVKEFGDSEEYIFEKLGWGYVEIVQKGNTFIILPQMMRELLSLRQGGLPEFKNRKPEHYKSLDYSLLQSALKELSKLNIKYGTSEWKKFITNCRLERERSKLVEEKNKMREEFDKKLEMEKQKILEDYKDETKKFIIGKIKEAKEKLEEEIAEKYLEKIKAFEQEIASYKEKIEELKNPAYDVDELVRGLSVQANKVHAQLDPYMQEDMLLLFANRKDQLAKLKVTMGELGFRIQKILIRIDSFESKNSHGGDKNEKKLLV